VLAGKTIATWAIAAKPAGRRVIRTARRVDGAAAERNSLTAEQRAWTEG